MTIAACYVSPEGVVLGADSATTFGSHNHLMHGQKIFEVGEHRNATLGLTMWGLGSLGNLSYRTLIGRLSEDVASGTTRPVKELVERWRDIFWDAYKLELEIPRGRIKDLSAQSSRSDKEEDELELLIDTLSGGFCLGGYSRLDRIPKSYSFTYSPEKDDPDPIEELTVGFPEFWGQPNMLKRLALGIDYGTFGGILEKKHDNGDPMWTGSADDLIAIVLENKLAQPSKHLPIREAIDWVYSSVYTTIKAMKFANMPPVCGGAIEIAVITSDRPFRWVRHKDLDTAIGRHPSREH